MKKGFTLIELLAVIVILAIIALIATPIIINIIDDSRKSSITESARLYISGLQNRILTENMTGEFNPSSCMIYDSELTCDDKLIDYQVNGQKPTSGIISFNNGSITSYILSIDGYNVTKNGDNITTNKDDGESIFTFIGIAYLDPTDLSATCTASDVYSNVNAYGTPTLIKDGCMKFYIFDDDSTNYTMILDHNITPDAPEDNYYPVTAGGLLSGDTMDWEVSARLITADEVAHIVGADSEDTIKWSSSKPEPSVAWYFVNGVENIDSDTNIGYFYLDGSGTTYSNADGWTKQVANSSNRSRYAWLYNYTNGCKQYGCDIEDNNEYTIDEEVDPLYSHGQQFTNIIHGYWTSTSSHDDYYITTWEITYRGQLNSSSRGSYFGVRPVITLPKSVIDN